MVDNSGGFASAISLVDDAGKPAIIAPKRSHSFCCARFGPHYVWPGQKGGREIPQIITLPGQRPGPDNFFAQQTLDGGIYTIPVGGQAFASLLRLFWSAFALACGVTQAFSAPPTPADDSGSAPML